MQWWGLAFKVGGALPLWECDKLCHAIGEGVLPPSNEPLSTNMLCLLLLLTPLILQHTIAPQQKMEIEYTEPGVN